MPAAFPIRGQWKLDTPNQRLAFALAVSLLVHGVTYVGWVVAPGVSRITRAAIAKVFNTVAPSAQQAQSQPKPPPQETAMVFVEVDPALASAAPPKETKNYSTHNAVAANPATQPKSEAPKIDGSQTRMLRMADNPKPSPQPLQPTPPKEQPKAESEKQPEEQTKKSAPAIGGLAVVRPQPNTTPDKGPDTETKPQRPRTLREVVQRNPSLAGQKTLQDGGVERRAHVSMVDAKASPFGDYDYAFCRAVEQRWFQLLDENRYMLDQQGEVTLTFRIHQDGRISDMGVASASVGDILALLCQKAVLDPAPFPKWPTAMRQAVRADYREVRFRFFYDCCN